MASKQRIDIVLVKEGYFHSREQAKRAIMAGLISDEHGIIDKPGALISDISRLHVKGNVMPYVSRGGLKLERAIAVFNLSVQDVIMADIGSSTGGFTDCALQKGAKLVYAIDVGTNQLVWKLRNDERVIVKEKTNFRYATKELFERGLPNFITIDVSFISLFHIFTPLSSIVPSKTPVVALIKPQFEAGKEQVGKHGIIKDPKVHKNVLEKVRNFARELSFYMEQVTYSPITGGKGNIEFLALFVKDGEDHNCNIDDLVEEASRALKGR